jgi:transcriptional regulator with XRE-family HTH domain
MDRQIERQSPHPLDRIAPALRRERSRAGLSLSELARSAGVAKSTLSQLEAGVGNPSVETLWALAAALGVPLSRLLDPVRAPVTVIRRGHGIVVPAERSNYVAALLSACPPGARRDIYQISVEPGPPRESDPHPPGTMEHVLVSAGRALVGPHDDPVEVAPGDFVTYPGDEPHICAALEPGTLLIFVMEYV